MKAGRYILAAVLFFGLALAQKTITLKAWTIGPDDPSITRLKNLEAAVERLNALLEIEGADYRVKLEGDFDTTDWDPYLRRVLLAFQSGEAPDIVQASAAPLIGVWATAGYIAPITAETSKYGTFKDVFPTLWNAVTYKGEVFGVPQDTEARPLYFNKTLLKKLGWSDAKIAELPRMIAEGKFTWDDMLAVAKEALDKGVIERGKGYYHRPKNGPDFHMWYRAFGGTSYDEASGKLVFDKAAALRYFTWLKAAVDAGVLEKDRLDGNWNRFHQNVTAGKVLFFSGGTWNWAEWKTQWVKDKGGEDWLWQNFGFAPQPAYKKGGKAVTLSNPQAYMVSANSKHKELAAKLLAFVMMPDLDARHAVGSGHLPVLQATASLTGDRFIREVSYLLNYTTFAPQHPDFPKWQDALYRGVSAVESGQVSPKEAVEVVAAEMKRALKDQVLIK